jgi:hypothetical protein
MGGHWAADVLKAAYLLAVNIGEWLPLFVACVFLTALLAWALWLNFCWRR